VVGGGGGGVWGGGGGGGGGGGVVGLARSVARGAEEREGERVMRARKRRGWGGSVLCGAKEQRPSPQDSTC